MKASRDLQIIYFFSVLVAIYSISNYSPILHGDSPSYLDAWYNFKNGHIDKLRTPLYPLYLGVIKMIIGTKYFILMSIVGQTMLFLFSIYVFYKLAIRIVGHQNVAFWITLFYGTSLHINQWNGMIMTESLSISGSIFMLYSILRLYDCYSLKWGMISAAIIMLLLLQRPSFIYILPILFLGWLMCFRKKKKQAITGVLGVFISSAILFLYMYSFKQSYGIWASSSVSTVNNYHIARQYNLLNADVIKDVCLQTDIDSILVNGHKFSGLVDESDFFPEEVINEENFIFSKYELQTINSALRASFESSPINYIKSAYIRFYKSAFNNAFIIFARVKIDLFFIYLFLFLYGLIIIRWSLLKKCVPWMTIIIYLLCIGNILVSIIGAWAGWNRLIMPSIPLTILLFGQFISLFRRKSIIQLEII